MKNSRVILTTLMVLVTMPLASIATAQSKSQNSKQAVKKLPSKAPKKRTFLDFTASDSGNAVVFKSLSPLNKALIKSDADLAATGRVTEVRSRNIIAAPQGDLAEPLSALPTETRPRPTPRTTVTKSTPTAPVPAKPIATPTPAPVVAATPAPTPVPGPVETKSTPEPIVATVETVVPETAPAAKATEVATEPVIEPTAAATPAIATKTTYETTADERAKSTFFLRTGYLNAGYKKYDDRMTNGATSIGIATAREFGTSLGQFEGRAAFDVYHSTDQSISIANVRMISLRAEATHWLTSSRVKPGLTLGVGWTESSIRSYRSVGPTAGDVTVRTHAEGHSLGVIPAATLRVELSKQFKVDLQVEYLALFGSEASEASRGAALTVSFGWTQF